MTETTSNPPYFWEYKLSLTKKDQTPFEHENRTTAIEAIFKINHGTIIGRSNEYSDKGKALTLTVLTNDPQGLLSLLSEQFAIKESHLIHSNI